MADGKRFIIVDDEISFVELVKAALEMEGHAVFTVFDGESALRLLDSQPFDVVISDLKMPGKDGMDFYVQCQEEKPDLARRFFFLTDDVVSAEVRKCFHEHRLSYLTKPFDISALRDLVNE